VLWYVAVHAGYFLKYMAPLQKNVLCSETTKRIYVNMNHKSFITVQLPVSSYSGHVLKSVPQTQCDNWHLPHMMFCNRNIHITHINRVHTKEWIYISWFMHSVQTLFLIKPSKIDEKISTYIKYENDV
jgi:hypothetical protein